ncbi:MAG: ATP-binding protein [Candidatus Zixiibacteriota bacterium]
MARLGQSLAVKLFAILLIVVGVGFGVSGWLTVNKHTNTLMAQILLSADRVADLLQSATQQGMMRNRRDDVREIIQTIGREPGVDGIRIYNKTGEIIVSTDSTEQFTRVDAQAEACVVCHTPAGALTTPLPDLRYRIVNAPDGHRTLGLISPIRNQPSCAEADCHAHPPDREVLGVFDVRMSLAQVDEALIRSQHDLITWSVILAVLAAAASGLLVWWFIHRPVRQLIQGTRELAAGNLDHRIRVRNKDELGQLAIDFNTMTAELSAARSELTEWARTLETRVEQKSRELERAHNGMAQMDRLASLGRLAATVAHELNNPLSGIATYVRLGMRRLKKVEQSNPPITETVRELELVDEELGRCGNIVKNLLLFSRGAPGEHTAVAMEDVIRHCTQLIGHHLRLHEIQLRTECEPGAIAHADPQQMRQALLAMLMNSVEAMPAGGELTVSARMTGGGRHCELVVADTGRGIPASDLPHIFEPFFSSKADASGVGLGLSVVYGIIQNHDGHIDVESRPGQGTRMIITLPAESSDPAPRAGSASEVPA